MSSPRNADAQIKSVVEVEQKTEEAFPIKEVFYYCYNLLELQMKTYELSFILFFVHLKLEAHSESYDVSGNDRLLLC